MPLLNENGKIETPITAEAAHLDLLHKLQASTSPLSLLFTGPLSDLARALEIDPAIEKKLSG
ncbi:inosine-uridine preferring nucleoside hydrolase [Liquorilactobacillus sucicola DSM 21376 = JCM 15457]|nr:inosine-uridine preferring nucleoside hydrolase [Liquorilactobacillus sucicola DSM 21376 = JCM 15457]